MPATTAHVPGIFCWPELCSADVAASKKFYASMFGWESSDIHMHAGDYTLLKLGSQRVGAMYQMTEHRKIAGILPHWNSYVAVVSADETAKNATILGGKVLREPFGADANRMANLQDPTGAKFCVWEISEQPQATRLNEIGALCWTELYTRDPVKAADFYSGLFGWRPQPWKGGAMPYTMFNLADEDRPACGMLAMPSEMPGPSQWLPYFQVEDADRSADRNSELGGKTCSPLMDLPDIGRMAMLTDAQGAGFAVIKLVGN
jgi:predicted enzyme related to lactoylglutathione lyase